MSGLFSHNPTALKRVLKNLTFINGKEAGIGLKDNNNAEKLMSVKRRAKGVKLNPLSTATVPYFLLNALYTVFNKV